MTDSARPCVVGVRPPPTAPEWEQGRLRYARPGRLDVRVGDWVVVESQAGEGWVGEVIVAPEQLVESPPMNTLPTVARLARPDERPPARAVGAGLSLLDSLGMPEWATRPSRETATESVRELPTEEKRQQEQRQRQRAGPDPAPSER